MRGKCSLHGPNVMFPVAGDRSRSASGARPLPSPRARDASARHPFLVIALQLAAKYVESGIGFRTTGSSVTITVVPGFNSSASFWANSLLKRILEAICSASTGRPSLSTRIHLPASRPGVLPVPCAAAYQSGRCVIKADVLQPGGFWTRLAQRHAAPSRDIPQAEPEGAPHAA